MLAFFFALYYLGREEGREERQERGEPRESYMIDGYYGRSAAEDE